MGYKTVKSQSETELEVKHSTFTGRCFPVTEEAQALAILEGLRKKYWDATHHCFAYSIGANGATARYSDDGEPSGTAGQPILEAIRHRELTNVLVVVTRYFGGILLGTGGLVRAYGASASEALDAAGLVEMRECTLCALEIPYPLWGKLSGLIQGGGGIVESIVYGAAVEAELYLPSERVAWFTKEVTERTAGTVEVLELGESIRAFPAGGERSADQAR